MPLMTWNNSFSVGIDEMDIQHKKLFNLTNKLFEAMQSGKGKEILHGVLSELASYTRVHFEAEEQLMQKHNFPGLDEHKALHRQLLTKASDFINKFNSGDVRLSISLCDFLQDWLKIHISEQDKQYGKHIASQPISVG